MSAPELPYCDVEVQVEANTPGYDMHDPVQLRVSSGFYDVDRAEEIGLAILRAVREARAAQ